MAGAQGRIAISLRERSDANLGSHSPLGDRQARLSGAELRIFAAGEYPSAHANFFFTFPQECAIMNIERRCKNAKRIKKYFDARRL